MKKTDSKKPKAATQLVGESVRRSSRNTEEKKTAQEVARVAALLADISDGDSDY